MRPWSTWTSPIWSATARISTTDTEVAGVEAGAVAGVAGAVDLVDLDQQRVAVAIQPQVDQALHLAGFSSSLSGYAVSSLEDWRPSASDSLAEEPPMEVKASPFSLEHQS